MSVSLQYVLTLNGDEVLENNVGSVSGNDGKTVKHGRGYNSGQTLTGASAVPITKVAVFTVTLTTGAAALDLTALTGTNGLSTSFDGLKVRFARFRNLGANPMLLEPGESNGYSICGDALTVPAGGEVVLKMANAAPTVGSGAKAIDITGTGSQQMTVELYAG